MTRYVTATLPRRMRRDPRNRTIVAKNLLRPGSPGAGSAAAWIDAIRRLAPGMPFELSRHLDQYPPVRMVQTEPQAQQPEQVRGLGHVVITHGSPERMHRQS